MRERTRDQWVVMLASLILLSAGQARSVDAQEGSKDIGVVKSEEVVDRPAGSVVNNSASGATLGNKSAANKPRTNRTYRSSRAFSRAVPAAMEYAQLGVTIWRLQKADGAKELGQEGEEAKLEQVESSTALTIGSTVRIGIEPLTRDGFLYVIDREQFADGTYGAARLIFPTLRTRNGNNGVRAHELVLIPRPPSYFRINPSSTGRTQTAEELTMIFSPTALQLPEPLGDKPITLSDSLFKSWVANWSVPMNVLELDGGAGTTMSVKQQTDGAKGLDQEGQEAQQLTQEDPLPQTVYRATIRRGAALLVTVPLRFQNCSVTFTARVGSS